MKKEIYNLTNPQKSIWLTEQYYKGSSINNIIGRLTIDEPVNFDLLQQSINIVIKNNDGIRLRLISNNDSVNQYVSSYKPINFKILNLKNKNDLSCIEDNLATTCFDIIDNDLFEFILFKFPNGHGGIYAKLHHIICDAWTMSFITNQIIENYSNLIHNREINNISYSYLDFIKSEKDYLNSSKFQKSKEFWDSKFDSLSFSYITENTSSSCTAKRKSYLLDKTLCNNISNFCSENKTSQYCIFMSVLSIYLARINNVSNPIVGTPVLNRCNFKEKNTIRNVYKYSSFQNSYRTNKYIYFFIKGFFKYRIFYI